MQQPRFHPPQRLALARLRPRSVLFTLFGDYVYPQRGEIWLGGLVRLGSVLGLSETAVRSAAARLTREGWVAARRRGHRSYYRLSKAGRALIEQGTRRIYRANGRAWNGSWCLLTYSIPEAKRAVRDRIRKQLAWLGFAPLRSGIYIAPRDRSREVVRLAHGAGAAGFARTFVARGAGRTSDAQLVRECWNLPAIGRAYRRFLADYEPRLAAHRAQSRLGLLTDQEAFVTRFMLTHEFRRFPFVDPDLPDRLLPRQWTGKQARRLFETYHAMLTRGALRFFESCARPSSS